MVVNMTVMERDQIVMVTCKPMAARWRNVTNCLCFCPEPFPVMNVTVTENDQIVTITWKAAAASRQESFLIRYRPTLRDSSSSWLEQTAVTQASQFSQAFPGEKYEIIVLAISNGQKSDPSNATVVIGKWCCRHCQPF